LPLSVCIILCLNDNIMNKNFLKNQREIIILILFFCIVGGLFYFVIFPLLGKITETKNAMQENAIKQEIKSQRLNELPKIRQQYTQIDSQQGKLDILLSKEQVVVLIERLEKLAQETNSAITISIKDDAAQKNGSAAAIKKDSEVATLADSLPSKDYLKLTISLVGDYDGIFKFISGLESLEYYGDITGINISHAVESKLPIGVSPSSNSGILNPFNTKSSAGQTGEVLSKQDTNKLNAILDVVFYSKK